MDVLISSERFVQWLSDKCWIESHFRPSRHKIKQAIVHLREMAKRNAKRQERESERQRLHNEYLQSLPDVPMPTKKKQRKAKPVDEPEPEIDIGKFSQEFWIEEFPETQKYDPEWADEVRAYLDNWEKETGKLIDPRLREIISRNLPKELSA